MPGTTGIDEPRHDAPTDLPRHLDEWVGASLITHEQADRIRTFESGAAERAPAPRIPLVAEALGYLGAALALAAGRLILFRAWEDMATGARLTALGITVAILFVGGLVAGRSGEPAIARLGSVLWALSAAVSIAFLAVLGTDAFHLKDPDALLLVGVGVTVYAGVMYAFRRQSLQQLALFAGFAIIAADVGARLARGDAPWLEGKWLSFVVWALGIAWALLAWRRVVTPTRTGLVVGSVAALYAGAFVAPDTLRPMLLLCLATAAGIITASVALRQTPLLGIGAVGLFIYTIATITEFFGNELGTPIALLVAGVLLLGVALLATRLRWFKETGSRGAPA